MGTIDPFEERLPAIIEPSFYLGSRKYSTLKLENRREKIEEGVWLGPHGKTSPVESSVW
jgi:hypothetical protein